MSWVGERGRSTARELVRTYLLRTVSEELRRPHPYPASTGLVVKRVQKYGMTAVSETDQLVSGSCRSPGTPVGRLS